MASTDKSFHGFNLAESFYCFPIEMYSVENVRKFEKNISLLYLFLATSVNQSNNLELNGFDFIKFNFSVLDVNKLTFIENFIQSKLVQKWLLCINISAKDTNFEM